MFSWTIKTFNALPASSLSLIWISESAGLHLMVESKLALDHGQSCNIRFILPPILSYQPVRKRSRQLDLEISQNVEIYDHLENAAACPCKTLLEQRNRGNALRKAIFLKTKVKYLSICVNIYHWLLLSIVFRLVGSQLMDQDEVIDAHRYFWFCHNPFRNSSLSASFISRDSQLKVLSNCPINFSPTVPTETSSSLTILAKEVTPAPWNTDPYLILVFWDCQPECHRARSDQTRTCQLYNWEPSHGLWPSHCCAPWVQYYCFQSDWCYA